MPKIHCPVPIDISYWPLRAVIVRRNLPIQPFASIARTMMYIIDAVTVVLAFTALVRLALQRRYRVAPQGHCEGLQRRYRATPRGRPEQNQI